MTKRSMHIFLYLLLALALRGSDRFKLEENDTVRQTFGFGQGSNAHKVLVDNVNGFIHVTSYSGSGIQMVAHKKIRAESKEAMEEAKRDVKLDTSQQGNFVRLYVDGPFRSHDGHHDRGSRYYGYEVTFDFDVQIPADTEVTLATVNGEVTAEGVSSHFDVSNINGGIDMKRVAGSGTAHTINGSLTVHFRKNPTGESSFNTLNGALDVYFQPNLSANLKFKTFNGSIFSDFDVLPAPAETTGDVERGKGKFIYRGHRFSTARAGAGGPELVFDAFNGNIRLHQAAQ